MLPMAETTPTHLRAVKGGAFQWGRDPPGDRPSRKQPEQLWSRRNSASLRKAGHELLTARNAIGRRYGLERPALAAAAPLSQTSFGRETRKTWSSSERSVWPARCLSYQSIHTSQCSSDKLPSVLPHIGRRRRDPQRPYQHFGLIASRFSTIFTARATSTSGHGLRRDCADATTGVPQTAADLLHRASRQDRPKAVLGCRSGVTGKVRQSSGIGVATLPSTSIARIDCSGDSDGIGQW
jgi:hypothetical protein